MPFVELMLIISSYNVMIERLGEKEKQQGKPLQMPNPQEFEAVLQQIKNRHKRKTK